MYIVFLISYLRWQFKYMKTTGLGHIIKLDPVIADFTGICQSGISLAYKTRIALGNSQLNVVQLLLYKDCLAQTPD